MNEKSTSKHSRLVKAVELVKDDRREEAQELLRDLIREDNDFESAWLWMAVAVDSIDLSGICLDNVLRINPENVQAAEALHLLREDDMTIIRERSRLLFWRNMSFGLFWLLVFLILNAVIIAHF